MLVLISTDAGTTAPVEPLLRALADPVRLRIVTALAAEQLCVCHLQDELGARQTLVSHHLRALREVGLVEASPQGRYVYYRLRPEALTPLRDLVGSLAVADRAAPRRACP